ncbi:GAF and ANTAR domain-containing protein [Flindersiella endophytica]
MVRVCQACVALLPVDGASISVMLGRQHRQSLYATDSVVERMEAVQFGLGEGPCYEAFETGRPVLVPDLERDAGASWPVFAGEIRGWSQTEPAMGRVGAVFAFPLRRGAARFGAIDLYRREPGWLSDAEVELALRITDVATSALLAVSSTGPEGEISEAWLLDLTRDRAVVHQATGIVIAQFGIPADEALARLRGYAFTTGRLLEEIASDLVARRLHPRVIQT